LSSYTVTHTKPESFYDNYFRKSELQHQTHYCPGCGHGIVHKLVALAIDQLGIQDRTIFISPVGCSVFAYYYFDVGNIQAAHGRAAAVATGAKRARPESIVISYQGDGDLAAIGTAELIHAANRGENLTVIFVNNAIYGMTGGQMAPTTLIGQKTSTTPFGRSVANEGYPLHVCELLSSLEAPVYLERVAVADNKGVMKAAKAIRRALENQVKGLGFSLVEVLSPCPTIWKMNPVEAQGWVRDEMMKVFPPGVFRDRIKDATPAAPLPPAPPLGQIPTVLEIGGDWLSAGAGAQGRGKQTRETDYHIKVAGFGARRAAAGATAGGSGAGCGAGSFLAALVRPGDALGDVELPRAAFRRSVDSPLVSRPNMLLALNEPSW
jgi:2-oxoisovalerate ferredoxin oxidoreductase beta subunit